MNTALGFRAHSGWATLVAVAQPARSPSVVDRRRIELADPDVPGSKQPYHAAEGLDLEKAEKIVRRAAEEARRLARDALGVVLRDLSAKGHHVVGCGLLLASGRALTTLEATLASHALIHTAEGELFREALVHASEQCAVPLSGVREREVHARAASRLGLAEDELRRRVGEMGRTIGPPWRQDEKLAALVGWLVLATAGR